MIRFRTCSRHNLNIGRKSCGSESKIMNLDTIWFLKCGFPRVRALLLENHLIFEMCHLEDNASHHVCSFVARFPFGRITWDTPFCRVRSGTKHSPHMRTNKNHLEIIKINDLENEPRHVGRLANASNIIRDNVWHREISANLISRSRFCQECQDS